jgi:hypothetical protein
MPAIRNGGPDCASLIRAKPSNYSHKVRSIMSATMAVSAAAAPIETGVGSVAIVTTHRTAVRSRQTEPTIFDAEVTSGHAVSFGHCSRPNLGALRTASETGRRRRSQARGLC